MRICQDHHEPIVFAGEGKCPLCTEMESNRLLYGEINYLINELKEKEKCVCQTGK